MRPMPKPAQTAPSGSESLIALLEGIGIADLVIAAHAGGEINDHIHVAGTQALDDLTIEPRVTAALTRLGIAHMDMHHGGAGICRLDRRISDLLWRYRDGRMLA